jgi:hypothetical protein
MRASAIRFRWRRRNTDRRLGRRLSRYRRKVTAFESDQFPIDSQSRGSLGRHRLTLGRRQLELAKPQMLDRPFAILV